VGLDTYIPRVRYPLGGEMHVLAGLEEVIEIMRGTYL